MRYKYVGSRNIRESLSKTSNRIHVTRTSIVSEWIKYTHQPQNDDGTITLTFIIDLQGQLWINDRHSEHVLCANGEAVLSAGEITFEIDNKTVVVVDITNQSTGYCPQPESYFSVQTALEQTDIPYPPNFTTAYHFRRCDHCDTTNIIKDDWYVCAVCDAELSQDWNYG